MSHTGDGDNQHSPEGFIGIENNRASLITTKQCETRKGEENVDSNNTVDIRNGFGVNEI